LLVFVAGALWVHGTRPEQQTSESDRPAGIVLVQRAAGETRYFNDDAEPLAAAGSAAVGGKSADGAAALASALPTNEPPPLLPGVSLPSLPGAVVSGEGLVASPQPGSGRGKPIILPGLDDAAIRAADAGIPQAQPPTGPTAKLSLFGSGAAEGRSFVFLIDRSASMGGEGLGAIAAAAKEFALQLDALTAQQQFQVLVYNQAVAAFAEGGLVPADEPNKKSLIRFVADTAAYGQTEHARGLLAALRLKPEVIFLLTDGGDPLLDPGQLRTIRESAAGRTAIHCVQFGRGAAPPEHFLRKLAAENGGSYVYIDMNRRR
jgi:hypothetical protein